MAWDTPHHKTEWPGIFGMREVPSNCGTFTIQAQNTKGTCVLALLPLPANDSVIAKNTMTRRSKPMSDEQETSGQPIRVLLADDHDILRQACASSCKRNLISP